MEEQYEVETADEDGVSLGKQERKRTVKREQTGTRRAFMKIFNEVLTEYATHRHAANWNADQFDEMIDKLQPGHIILLEDYGMNYSHVHKDEMQSEFWTHHQTTVFPIVAYRAVFDPNTGQRTVQAESWVFLSDDLKHDNDFARHCSLRVIGEYHAKLGYVSLALGCVAAFASS